MSDLYDIFGAAAAQNPQTDEQRRDVLVQAIGGAAARRRRRRVVGTALASVTGVVAIAGTVVALDLGLGGDGLVAEPGHGNPSAASSPAASADATDGATPGPTVWDLAAPGWFMVETRTAADRVVRSWDEEVTRASGGDVVLIGPDGRTYEAGSLDAVDYTRVIGWGADGLRLFTETEAGEFEAGRGEISLYRAAGEQVTVAARVDSPLIATVLDGSVIVQQRPAVEGYALTVSDDYEEAEPRCFTTDDAGEAAVSPDGSVLVCFTALTPDGTDVTVVNTEGRPESEVLATFTYPAWTYSRIGWVSDTVLLFARYTDPGYRYFTLDVETGAVSEAALPESLDGALPTYDLESNTFRLPEEGAVVFTTVDGDGLAEVACDQGKLEPTVAMSGHRALVVCAGLANGTSAVTLVDLETGATSEVMSLETQGRIDQWGSIWGYPTQRSAE